VEISHRGQLYAYAMNVIYVLDPSGQDGLELSGPEELKKKMEALLEKMKKDGSAEVKAKIKEMESDKKACKIVLVTGSKTVLVGSWNTGEVDVGDIEKLPPAGTGIGFNQEAALLHELTEQYEKQVKDEKAYLKAHAEATAWEEKHAGGKISGNKMTQTAGAGFSGVRTTTFTKTTTNPDGSTTTTTETDTVNVSDGNITGTTVGK